MTQLYAHSGDGFAPQLYAEHVHNVRNRALASFDKVLKYHKNRKLVLLYRRTLEVASEWHDSGKIMTECQQVLSQSAKSDEPMLNHVDAGVAHCIKEYERTNELYYLLAAWLILAHHIGFQDWEELTKLILVNPNQILSATKLYLKDKWRDYRIQEYVDANLSAWEQLHKDTVKIADSMPETGYSITIKDIDWFDILMCFSCMVEADHYDTNRHFSEGKGVLPEPYKLRADERIVQLDRYVAKLSKGKTDDRTRDRLLLYAAADKDNNSSWVKDDGPVGVGKTNANHKKALKMAKKYGCDRIMSVVPFTNVIHQLVGKAKESLLLSGEYKVGVVNELHSTVEFKDWWLRRYNNRWDGPLTYTTCVQYFESLATYHPAAVGKLIHFANSILILDEYQQSMPYELWSHALFLLQKLVENYNVHIILSSGTPIDFHDLYHKNIVVENILSNADWKHLQKAEKDRVKYYQLGSVGLERLCKHISNGYKDKHSTLIICNTTKNAAVLWERFSINYNDVYHLSSRLTPEHRERQLEIIKDRLVKGLPTILVATSTVECGVDISFERVYREETSLDSLLQSAGRCNRNNEIKLGKVYVFRFNQTLIDDGTLSINPTTQRAINVFRKLDKKEWNPTTGTSAVRDTLTPSNMNTIIKMESDFARGNLRSVGQAMRLIKTVSYTIVIDPAVVTRIKAKDITLSYVDITRNSVSVFANVHQRLLAMGVIKPLEKVREKADDPITMWGLLDYDKNYDANLGIGKILL